MTQKYIITTLILSCPYTAFLIYHEDFPIFLRTLFSLAFLIVITVLVKPSVDNKNVAVQALVLNEFGHEVSKHPVVLDLVYHHESTAWDSLLHDMEPRVEAVSLDHVFLLERQFLFANKLALALTYRFKKERNSLTAA